MLNLSILHQMKHSRVDNYVVPGLSSYLIGNNGDKGLVRLFECSREHQETIVPHSHRFDFTCFVLSGSVKNRIWTKSNSEGDHFQTVEIIYNGEIGNYERNATSVERWTYSDITYLSGESYEMHSSEIHSIFFQRGTSVLFFEGPQTKEKSIILEPFSNGEHIQTMRVESWMFRKYKSSKAGA